MRTVYDRLSIAPACPVIIVAGTNGKGSTSAFLERMLVAAGYRVGLYTSPHLLHSASTSAPTAAVIEPGA